MTFPLGFEVSQLIWSLLIPLGFALAVVQIEYAAHVRIFLCFVLGLTALSWIAYEIVRCTAFPHSKDIWGLLVARVIVLWVALYGLWKEVHPRDEESELKRPLVAFLYVSYFLGTFFGLLSSAFCSVCFEPRVTGGLAAFPHSSLPRPWKSPKAASALSNTD